MKKKILFIIWSLSYGGGAEKILANIVNNLNQDKYDIEILEYLHSDKKEVINPNIKIYPPIIDTTKKDVASKIYNHIIDRLLMRVCPQKIRKANLKTSYDVEISFNYLIPTFLLDRECKRKIAWMHSTIYDLEDSKFMKQKQRKSLKEVNKIVAISEVTEQSVRDEFPEFQNKILKIYNGYDFSKMSSDEVVDDFQLLYCNRFDENKNPLQFIRIVKILKDSGMDVTAKMLGTGDLFDEAKVLIKKYNLDANIECVGYKKNPYSYYKHCKVFCLTSHVEGFPTTIVEAMFFGKPFVSTKVAGTKELTQNGLCGFAEADENTYVKRVAQLLEDEELYKRMSVQCKENVTQYSLQNQIRKIEKCIDSL